MLSGHVFFLSLGGGRAWALSSRIPGFGLALQAILTPPKGEQVHGAGPLDARWMECSDRAYRPGTYKELSRVPRREQAAQKQPKDVNPDSSRAPGALGTCGACVLQLLRAPSTQPPTQRKLSPELLSLNTA